MKTKNTREKLYLLIDVAWFKFIKTFLSQHRICLKLCHLGAESRLSDLGECAHTHVHVFGIKWKRRVVNVIENKGNN